MYSWRLFSALIMALAHALNREQRPAEVVLFVVIVHLVIIAHNL